MNEKVLRKSTGECKKLVSADIVGACKNLLSHNVGECKKVKENIGNFYIKMLINEWKHC
jgi:hypothetical protein